MKPQVPNAFRIAAGNELAPVMLDTNWQRVPRNLIPLLQKKEDVRFFFVFEGGREVEVTDRVRNVDWTDVPSTGGEIPVSLLVPDVWDIVEGVVQ